MSKNMLVILSLGLVFSVSGCGPDPDTSLDVRPNNDRFSVTQIGIFEDRIAYGNKRGIYLLKDKITGQEYVGVSGVGISEIGFHSTGKSGTSDER